MQKPRFKIDTTGCKYIPYGVYELKFGIWWKVFDSSKVDLCEDFVEEARKLPKYYYPDTSMGMKNESDTSHS